MSNEDDTSPTSLAVRLALMERDRQADREDLKALRGTLAEATELLKKSTRQLPQVEVHDGTIHASCPNCQTERTVGLPPAEQQVGSFDDVIGLLDAPHREAGGKKVSECPGCRPKFEAKLKELGYGPLAPVAAPPES